MRICLAGPGRAGLGLAIAAHGAGHEVVAIAARRYEHAVDASSRFGAQPMRIGEPFPDSDLLVIAVRDDAIQSVAGSIAQAVSAVGAAVHLSGLVSVKALDSLRPAVASIGSFHPLQTMPTAEAGAARLLGAWVAVTAGPELGAALFDLAESLGAVPFALADHHKAVYHAGAAAAANFTLAALVMADDLMAAAGVPFAATQPLVEAVVANAYELGARASLTGPVARGDVATVAAQLAAVRDEAPEWSEAFSHWVEVLARVTGRTEEFEMPAGGNGSRS